ncbi:MAG: efflux RND transporter periplasmic adaptor subunit [Pseudomonadota bacterium]
MRKKDYIGMGTVILAFIVVGFFILGAEPHPSASIENDHGHGHGDVARDDREHGEHGHRGEADSEHHDHEGSAKGPHGGRLLVQGHFEVEVVIFEDGVPPRFRVYCYEGHKPVDPRQVSVSVELKRLGNRITRYKFEPKGGFLHSDTVVEEPHSFEAKVVAEHEGKSHEWEFSQVEGRIELVPEAADTVGIEVETAGSKRIRSVLELPGEVVLNADRVCHVVPRVSGVVSECRKNLGDTVKAGEVVAVIDSRELADAGSQYLVRFHREELARINFERTKRLWEDRVSPEKEYLDANKEFQEARVERVAASQKLRALGFSGKDIDALREHPEASMTDYPLKAPFDGVVITKHMSTGEWVEEKADILGIADLSTVWVDITVYADNLHAVRVGQEVTVKSDAGGLTADGAVSYIAPLVGEKSRTAKARVVIDNNHGKWRPGMFVSVRLIKEETEVPVAVKPEAIQTLERFGDAVFVRYGDYFEVRPIALGRRDSEHVEVVNGLSEGEKYAAAKSFLIKSEIGKSGLSHSH